MKGAVLAAAAAAISGASAASHRRHAHGELFKKGAEASVCVPGCTTIYTTIYGEPTLVPHRPSKPATSAAPAPTTEAPVPEAPTSTFKPSVDLPTPVPEICPTPGTYTFPATTITVSETTTVCGAKTTAVPSGTHTLGGVTTVVETATTVVCPYATVKTTSGVVTSVIETTTYVCPSAGTYTIAPTTTTVTAPTTCVYPDVTTVTPGTYTRPAVVTTVTDTSVIVVCPFTSEEPKPTSSVTSVAESPEPTAPAPVPTTSAVVSEPAPSSVASSSAPAPSSVASSLAPAPTSSAPATGGGLGGLIGGLIGNSGDHWAITYTPYSEDASGSCKSAGQVDSDIAAIKKAGFRTVRVYSTDCSTLENVGSACEKYGLKMIIGIFVKQTCDPNSQEIKDQVDAITAWKKWSLVDLVVVGNECIFQGRCSASSLKELIVSVKSTISGAGFSGPFTTAETVGVWQQTDVISDICDVIDIVGGQIHPYFNADTVAAAAGLFVKGQIELLESSAICGSKPALNLECGWPSSGSCNGKACPGPSEQAIAIQSIKALAGDKTVFFSFTNDEWKDPGACGCERSWGVSSIFGA